MELRAAGDDERRFARGVVGEVDGSWAIVGCGRGACTQVEDRPRFLRYPDVSEGCPDPERSHLSAYPLCG